MSDTPNTPVDTGPADPDAAPAPVQTPQPAPIVEAPSNPPYDQDAPTQPSAAPSVPVQPAPPLPPPPTPSDASTGTTVASPSTPSTPSNPSAQVKTAYVALQNGNELECKGTNLEVVISTSTPVNAVEITWTDSNGNPAVVSVAPGVWVAVTELVEG